MTLFKNNDTAYRAVVGQFEADLTTATLAEVSHADEASTYQHAEEGCWILGIHNDVLRFNPLYVPGAKGESKVVTWADARVISICKQHPWVMGWLLGNSRYIPVAKESWSIAKVRALLARKSCQEWGLPHGVIEEMVKRADAFSLVRNDALVDMRREQVPAGVLLYGLVKRGGRAERIKTHQGVNLVHGYGYLIEVHPKSGLLRIHTNQKTRSTLEDWAAYISFNLQPRRASWA